MSEEKRDIKELMLPTPRSGGINIHNKYLYKLNTLNKNNPFYLYIFGENHNTTRYDFHLYESINKLIHAEFLDFSKVNVLFLNEAHPLLIKKVNSTITDIDIIANQTYLTNVQGIKSDYRSAHTPKEYIDADIFGITGIDVSLKTEDEKKDIVFNAYGKSIDLKFDNQNDFKLFVFIMVFNYYKIIKALGYQGKNDIGKKMSAIYRIISVLIISIINRIPNNPLYPYINFNFIEEKNQLNEKVTEILKQYGILCLKIVNSLIGNEALAIHKFDNPSELEIIADYYMNMDNNTNELCRTVSEHFRFIKHIIAEFDLYVFDKILSFQKENEETQNIYCVVGGGLHTKYMAIIINDMVKNKTIVNTSEYTPTVEMS
jgi:hypothetical protein